MRNILKGGTSMRTIKANRVQVLEAVKANREKHIKEYKEAMEGYHLAMLDEIDNGVKYLNQQKSEVENGTRSQLESVVIILNPPVSHEKDYNQVIRMLEMETSDIIDVKSDEFACYVMDDWDWKESFMASNTTYKKWVG